MNSMYRVFVWRGALQAVGKADSSIGVAVYVGRSKVYQYAFAAVGACLFHMTLISSRIIFRVADPRDSKMRAQPSNSMRAQGIYARSCHVESFDVPVHGGIVISCLRIRRYIHPAGATISPGRRCDSLAGAAPIPNDVQGQSVVSYPGVLDRMCEENL